MNLGLHIEYSKLVFICGKEIIEYESKEKTHPHKRIELSKNDFERATKCRFLTYVIQKGNFLKVVDLEKVVY